MDVCAFAWDRPMSPLERFMAKVQVEDSGCWRWMAAMSSKGYGKFTVGHQRWTGAHRWIYEHSFGPVPEGLVLDHFACDNRWCVNPEHLRPVTQRENILRGTSYGALRAAQTHCTRGHEFTPENTRYRKNGCRRCMACNREQSAELRARIQARTCARIVGVL